MTRLCDYVPLQCRQWRHRTWLTRTVGLKINGNDFATVTEKAVNLVVRNAISRSCIIWWKFLHWCDRQWSQARLFLVAWDSDWIPQACKQAHWPTYESYERYPQNKLKVESHSDNPAGSSCPWCVDVYTKSRSTESSQMVLILQTSMT